MVREKTIALAIARTLRDKLEAEGASVIMKRNAHSTTSLAARVKIANDAYDGPTAEQTDKVPFVSVHVDST